MVPQNGWFIMGIPIKIDDLGVPVPPFFRKPPHKWMKIVSGEREDSSTVSLFVRIQ